ncbi:hypothetical protein C4K14_1431 [Pseudomonas chlororaphis subsp. aureofaciens]|nr:hypothetical protein C4K14_1431 [Pseudomonas chlororaphis subsp. aureofaciens]
MDACQHPILDYTEQLSKAAARLGFDCLDEAWRGWKVRYRFQCSQGHIFPTRPATFIHAVGCPTCAEIQRLEHLHTVAAKVGTTCLESRWLGAHAYHRFRCPKGHLWQRRGADARLDATCPRCNQLAAGRRARHADGLARLQAKAAQHGGGCLAIVYEGLEAYHRFRCSEGHIWEAAAVNVLLRDTWCRICAMREVGEKNRLSLEEAFRVAAERGGQCLSTSYLNTAVKMHWVCHRGHSWHAPFARVRAGHWCPECAHMAHVSNSRSKARMRYKVF